MAMSWKNLRSVVAKLFAEVIIDDLIASKSHGQIGDFRWSSSRAGIRFEAPTGERTIPVRLTIPAIDLQDDNSERSRLVSEITTALVNAGRPFQQFQWTALLFMEQLKNIATTAENEVEVELSVA